MAFGNEWEEDKKLAFENGHDAGKMLQLYIYNRMKKKNLHDAAETFAQEANLESSQLEGCDENLLTEWWESFWPTFCSRLSNEAGANTQSSGQPSMANALAMPASMKNQGASSSRQTPMWNPQQDVLPVIATSGMIPFNHLQQSTMENPARLVGPNSGYTIRNNYAGPSAAQALGKRPLGFPLVQLLPTRIAAVPPVSPSYLQMPITIQPPPQVARAYRNDFSVGRSVKLESTYPAGQGSTYPLAAPNAGEANWNNQLPLAGVRMAVPGPDLASYESRVPAEFLQLIQQVAQVYGVGVNPPPVQSCSRGSCRKRKE